MKNLHQAQVKIFGRDPIVLIPVLAHRAFLVELKNQSNKDLLKLDEPGQIEGKGGLFENW
jgi:hypothetical protein